MSETLLAGVQARPGDDEARHLYLEWLVREDPVRAACLRVDRVFSLLPSGHADYDDVWERLAWHTARVDPQWADRALHHYDVVLLEPGRAPVGRDELQMYLGCTAEQAGSLADRPAAPLHRGLLGAPADALRRRYADVCGGLLGLVLHTEAGGRHAIGAGPRYAVSVVTRDDLATDAVQRALDISWNDAAERIAAGPVATDLSPVEAVLLERQLTYLGARAELARR